jgi:hypothetical protein
VKKEGGPRNGLALFFAGRNNRHSQDTATEGRKVGLSDSQEPVSVTLCLDDWAMILFALSTADVPASTKERINTKVFECARETVRVLT